ncbi:RHS repeat-associated core domain-containing protein [Pseudomonas sp. RP23018S]|uniref:RHS repeat-associated core domain-containing protein n=1 Tax=Pseudomonas sp. RP23018S TaxID=3096037 RepID=UPI002ACA2980|nr:RHS repeat-associated core domain-containing protein [Pseudomonas sp. RP23018S]MDZ5604081.1 RHS repeat-associated core domain-containing protein [Pseudomonas sp. RP23018S]
MSQGKFIFYQANNIQSLVDSNGDVTLFRTASAPVAEITSGGATDRMTLLAVDNSSTPLSVVQGNEVRGKSFSTYGYARTDIEEASIIGFAGQPSGSTGLYLLGSYRLYSPVLMRCYSPDSFSPFSDGGVSAYAYCGNDPINYADPSGHLKVPRVLSFSTRPRIPSYVKKDRPPKYKYAIEPIFDPVPPSSDRDTLPPYPSERAIKASSPNPSGTTHSPLKLKYINRIKELNELQNQYIEYNSRQTKKHHAAYREYAKYRDAATREQPHTDLWDYYVSIRDREQNLVRHYQAKINTVKAESAAIRSYSESLQKIL